MINLNIGYPPTEAEMQILANGFSMLDPVTINRLKTLEFRLIAKFLEKVDTNTIEDIETYLSYAYSLIPDYLKDFVFAERCIYLADIYVVLKDRQYYDAQELNESQLVFLLLLTLQLHLFTTFQWIAQQYIPITIINYIQERYSIFEEPLWINENGQFPSQAEEQQILTMPHHYLLQEDPFIIPGFHFTYEIYGDFFLYFPILTRYQIADIFCQRFQCVVPTFFQEEFVELPEEAWVIE